MLLKEGLHFPQIFGLFFFQNRIDWPSRCHVHYVVDLHISTVACDEAAIHSMYLNNEGKLLF